MPRSFQQACDSTTTVVNGCSGDEQIFRASNCADQVCEPGNEVCLVFQQYADCIGSVTCRHQVKSAITIKITDVKTSRT